MQTQYEIQGEVRSTTTQPKRTIALIAWGDVWDDFLDSIGVSLETFCKDGPGGWMLGYMDALRLAGVRTVLVLISARVTAPSRFPHAPTGATILVLPAPKGYRAIRRWTNIPNPYLSKNAQELSDKAQNGSLNHKILRLAAPYLSTPLGLLAQELRRENCSAILCQDYEAPRFDACVGLGKLMGLPVFASFQGGYFDPNRLGRWLRPLTMKACAGLIIGSQTEIQRVRDRYRLQPSRIAQIFNPIDLGLWNASDRHEARASLGLPSEALVVVWHGRIELHTKRLDILLDAWKKICAKRPEQDLRLLLLGTGQDAEKLRQCIAELPIQNVIWMDKYATDRTEIRRFLSVGDVYAFPSVLEGFPVAPIEAMACGLPVVAAAASGVPDILKDGETSGGLIVPCGEVGAFTLALSRILDNHALRCELGQLARRRVEEAFSLEVVGKQLLDFCLSAGVSLANIDCTND